MIVNERWKERKFMDKLTEELFADIIAFSMSEPGAMGPNNMTFYKATGESFSVDYKEEGKYEELKNVFPALKECYWDGPMKNEIASLFTIVIGGSPDDKSTTVPKGMRHIYLDYGNHLAVKEEYYYAIKKYLAEKIIVTLLTCGRSILKKQIFQLD